MSEANAQQAQAIRYWFGMAHECVAAARREAEADALSFAMNRHSLGAALRSAV